VTSWLKPVIRALDERLMPIDLFFRNEDAGLVDDGLYGFVDVFAEHGLPVDLAIVPDGMTRPFAERLLDRIRHGYPIGLHQHGFAHRNHEHGGSLSEFGPSRGAAQQKADIAAGRALLQRLFEGRVDAIFTPPWDRCTAVTGRCLVECGITALSRTAPNPPLDVEGLTECPIWMDWFARRDGSPLTRLAWSARLAELIAATTQPLGLTMCQAVMDEDDQEALTALLRVLSSHANVRGVLMRDVAGAMIAAPPRTAAF
jgi:hypothetical protein